MKRIRPGRYEDGTYGIRRIQREAHVCWDTFLLSAEDNYDGGWMQTYGSYGDAKAGLDEHKIAQERSEPLARTTGKAGRFEERHPIEIKVSTDHWVSLTVAQAKTMATDLLEAVNQHGRTVK